MAGEVFDRYGAFHVTIDATRWNVYIMVDAEDGSPPSKFVASADSALTERDGIWFGTEAEYQEAVDRL